MSGLASWVSNALPLLPGGPTFWGMRHRQRRSSHSPQHPARDDARRLGGCWLGPDGDHWRLWWDVRSQLPVIMGLLATLASEERLVDGLGERARLGREALVVSGEGDGEGVDALSHRERGPMRHLSLRGLPDPDEDAGRGRL
jgi:hypothetical protein